MSVEETISALAQVNLPLLQSSAREVLVVSQDGNNGWDKIAEVIRRDPVLTARIFRVANSSLINAGRKPFASLSRALMMLGLDQLQDICRVTPILEKTTAPRFREQVLALLRQSVEVAAQAGFLAEKLHLDPEPYYLAGLLSEIARLAFWCGPAEAADAVHQQILHGVDSREAEAEVLGFRLDPVNEALLDHWGLSHLHRLPKVHDMDILVEARTLGELMRNRAYAALDRELLRLQGYFRQPLRELLLGLRRNQEQSHAVLPKQWLVSKGGSWPEADLAAQQQCLADLHALPCSGSHLSALVRTAAEGLRVAGGWDLCILALHSPNGWQARLGSGLSPERLKEWRIGALQPPELLDSDWQTVAAAGDGVLAEGHDGAAGILRLNASPWGLLYCDRSLSQRPPEEEQFLAFDRFFQCLQERLNNLSEASGA